MTLEMARSWRVHQVVYIHVQINTTSSLGGITSGQLESSGTSLHAFKTSGENGYSLRFTHDQDLYLKPKVVVLTIQYEGYFNVII
jgi:hypothetical protein